MEKLEIDLNRIIRSRVSGWKGRLIPGVLISTLERMIRQKELNAILDATWPAEGSEFADALYRCLRLSLATHGEDNIPAQGRFIFASNHPLGGLDGIGLIKVLGSRYGDDGIRFLVNDMLMNVEPLRTVFLPVNKYGSQGRAAAKAIAEAYASDMQMLIFPAGLVSRLHPDGSIRDLTWQKSFIQKAVEYERDIIPVRFDGLNRSRFYRTAYWRKRLGLKVNIEQAMLPAELCAARGNSYGVTFGRPVPWRQLADRLADGASPASLAAEIRATVHSLTSSNEPGT